MKLSSLINTTQTVSASGITSLNRLSSACARVHKRWPDISATPQQEREVVVRQMLRRVELDNWVGATLASVVRAGRVVFEEDFRDRVDFKKLRDFYLLEIESSSSQTFLGATMSVYLRTYVPGEDHTERLASALQKSRSRLGKKWLLLLDNVEYLLHPRNAAHLLGAAMCRMSDPWNELKAMGFHDPHALGFLLHSHLAYIQQKKSQLETEAGVRQMLDWLKPRGTTPRIEGAKQAIEALLDPWKTKGKWVQSKIQDQLVDGLVAIYGDPRVGHGHVWLQVAPTYRDVLIRWLTGANIEFFMDVVSKVETSHMWSYRREFWWKLYEQGRIDAAWVAFSPLASSMAKKLLEEEQQTDHLNYGVQTAGGSRRNTSLLIMQIGKCVVVEGSHSYKVHIFKRSNHKAPNLFQGRYDCELIRKVPNHFEQPHSGYWQDAVNERLSYWA